MKKNGKQSLFIAAGIIAVGQIFSNKIYRDVFYKRLDKREESWQYGVDHFEEMSRLKAVFPTKNDIHLVGYFYYNGHFKNPVKESKGIIILANGYMQSHLDYLYDINYLVKCGFMVFGYDNCGCYESGGEKTYGIEQTVIDLKYALNYIEGLMGKVTPMFIYGHSMGAYAGATVLNYSNRIKGVVLRSGFISPNKIIMDVLENMFGKASFVLFPFIIQYRIFLFGNVAFKNSVKAIKNTKIKVFLMQSEDDPIVSLKHSLYGQKKKFVKKENVYTRLYYGRGHDIVRSEEAMRYFHQKTMERKKINEQYGGELHVPTDVLDKFYQELNREVANRHEDSVLDLIARFFESCVV